MRRDEIVIEGVRWVEIANGAQQSGSSMVELRALVAAGKLASLEYEGNQWIHRAAVNRLKRENAVLKSARTARKHISGGPPHDLTGPYTRSHSDPKQLKLPTTGKMGQD